MVRSAFVILLVLPLLLAVPARGQPAGFTRSDAKIIVLADGRLAVIKAGPGGPVIEGLIDGERSTGSPVDLRVGDIIVRFQNVASPTAEQIGAAFEAAPVGAEIGLAVRRDGSERVVTFRRPATPGGARIAVAAPGGAGAGAWVTGGSAGGRDFVIAGVHLRENDEGLPEVSHRTSDPAGATVALRTGDVVAALNGHPIVALAGLEKWYAQVPSGDEIVLTIIRAGRTMTVTFAKPADR